MSSVACVIRLEVSYENVIRRPLGDVMDVRLQLLSRTNVRVLPYRSRMLFTAPHRATRPPSFSANVYAAPLGNCSSQLPPFQRIVEPKYRPGVVVVYTAFE